MYVLRQELLRGIITDHQGPSVITRALSNGREGFLMHSLERDEGRRAKGTLRWRKRTINQSACVLLKLGTSLSASKETSTSLLPS